MKALIDADILIYQAASTSETTIPWPFEGGDVLFTRHAHMGEAWSRFTESLLRLQEKVGASSFVAAVTDSAENWRFDVYPEYKSNRASGIKPMLVPELRSKAATKDWCRRIHPLEADDVLGILQTKPGAGATIIISADKDMQTIPGLHYNPNKDVIFEVTKGEANRYHLYQTLAGDATDGYPGCPKVGEVTANKLLPATVEDDEVEAVWREIVVPAFEKQGLTEEYALAQARVARILRASDYNPKTKEVLLWTPK